MIDRLQGMSVTYTGYREGAEQAKICTMISIESSRAASIRTRELPRRDSPFLTRVRARLSDKLAMSEKSRLSEQPPS